MEQPQKKTNKPKFEFSKGVLIFSGSIFLAYLVYSAFLMWRTLDTTPLAYIVPAIGGTFGTALGFYYNKAKAEAKIKLPYYLDANNQSNIQNIATGAVADFVNSEISKASEEEELQSQADESKEQIVTTPTEASMDHEPPS